MLAKTGQESASGVGCRERGRASAFQADCRGFESRPPLQFVAGGLERESRANFARHSGLRCPAAAGGENRE